MKKRTIIISTVIIVLFGVMAYTLASNKKEINSHKEVKVNDNKIAVTVADVKIQETTDVLEFVGTAEPLKEVMVSSEAAGKIVQLNFKFGDYVNKGTILGKVDDTYRRLAFESAQLNYNKFKDDYERFQILKKGDAISETQLRDMKMGYESACIQLENAKKQMEDTKIIAPFSGYITSKNAELGALVNIGIPIASMVDISELKILLSVSETEVYELCKGQEVNVSTSIYPGVNYKGVISNISPRGNSAHTYPVETIIKNDNKNPLKAGTYVNVQVNKGKVDKALFIPRDAIVSSVKDPSVYVVYGDTVRLVKINIGRNYNSFVEVLKGLDEGDLVVTNGQINLMDGAKVIVVRN